MRWENKETSVFKIGGVKMIAMIVDCLAVLRLTKLMQAWWRILNVVQLVEKQEKLLLLSLLVPQLTLNIFKLFFVASERLWQLQVTNH